MASATDLAIEVLPTPGGADQTEHLPAQLGRERLDRQKFHDALLDLFQAVMVAVEDGLRLGKVEPLLALFVPRQVEHRVQIGAHHALLRARAAQLGKSVHFLDELVLALLRQVQREHALAVALRLRCGILLAQLGLDDLDLLAQVILALVFIHLGLELVLDLIFDLEDLGLLAQQADHHRQAAGDAQLLQNLLLGVHLDGQVLRDEVSQPARLAALRHGHLHVGRDAGRILCIFRKALLRRAHQRLRAALGHAVDIVLQRLELRINAAVLFLGRFKLVDERARLALDQHADIVTRQAQDLPHHAHRADLVEVVRRGGVGLELALRGQENALSAFHRRLQRANGKHPADVEMDDHMGKRRQPAQRQHRQAVERRFSCSFHSPTPYAGKLLIASV